MADKMPVKVRCSVCGDGVAVDRQHIAEHNHKYAAGAKCICYGSFLPVFVDNKGQYQVGNVMYISRRRSSNPFEMEDPD